MSQGGMINVAGGGGGGSPILSITGNDGIPRYPTANNFNIVTANATVQFLGTTSTETLNFGLSNLILGSNPSGITTAVASAGFGSGVLAALTTAENSSAFGYNALASLTTGDANTAIGESTLRNITTGTLNIALGNNAGSSHTLSDSSNIDIGNIGTNTNSNTIRIGTQGSSAGQQDECFLAGVISGPTNNPNLATVASTGQLGYIGIGSSGQVLTVVGGVPTWTTYSNVVNFIDAVYAASTGTNLNATYLNGVSGVGATLTNAGSDAAFSLDSVSLASGSRVLIKDQTATYENGIYTVTTVGSGAVAWVLTRATDYNTPAEIQVGDIIPVQAGTVNANTLWLQTATVAAIGSPNAITFQQFSSGPLALPVSLANGGTGQSLSTTDNAVMITSGAGAVEFSQTLPSAVQSNITAAGAVTLTSVNFGQTTLSYYGEGTFTPTLDGSTPGTTTYTVQSGYYTRIGNMVTIYFEVALTSATGTGNIVCGGLPFTIKNQANYFPLGCVYWNGDASWTWPVSHTCLITLGNSNTTTFNIYALGRNISSSYVQMGSGSLTIVIQMSYFI